MSIDSAIAYLREHSRFILTAHETPDADAIGAECALYHALVQMGKNVRIINADPTPGIFSFIDDAGVVEVLDDSVALPDLSEWHLIMLDANDINNIGQVRALILDHVQDHFIIDHHEETSNLAQKHFIQGQSSSTCEMLYDVISRLGANLTPSIAQALFAGIVYDTGSFVYPKTTATTFKIAMHLSEAGVQPHRVFTEMNESNTIASLRLQSTVLSTVQLFFDDQVAVQKMTYDTLKATGARYEEGQSLINVPLKSKRIKVSVFFKENEGKVLRCSLRSKGEVDVAGIATLFGGGGHKNAAGFKCQSPLDEMEIKVLEIFARRFAGG